LQILKAVKGHLFTFRSGMLSPSRLNAGAGCDTLQL
jgi:hypothetical protein